MSKKDLNELSKIISHALRHQPSLYGLCPDKGGWVNVEDLIQGVRNTTGQYNNLSAEIIAQMIMESSKKRHQMIDGKIRALYGHSLKEKVIKEASIPPEILFHGTKKDTSIEILKIGLLPMQRQYVHLSEKKDDAFKVALRKTKSPVILKIKASQAFKDGICFYKEENCLWLSNIIPSKYIEINKSS